jgi:hypothetical protein
LAQLPIRAVWGDEIHTYMCVEIYNDIRGVMNEFEAYDYVGLIRTRRRTL